METCLPENQNPSGAIDASVQRHGQSPLTGLDILMPRVPRARARGYFQSPFGLPEAPHSIMPRGAPFEPRKPRRGESPLAGGAARSERERAKGQPPESDSFVNQALKGRQNTSGRRIPLAGLCRPAGAGNEI